MPKIFILMACEECNLCFKGGLLDDYYYCADTEQLIPDIGKIADFCELDDWEEE